MKALAVCLLALAAPAAAQLPSLAAFNEALAEAPAPAAVAAAVPAAAQTPAPKLPKKFELHERVLSWSTTFDIREGGKSYGKVTQKILSLRRSFTYEDASGACVAKAAQKILSWGVEIEVSDCSGRTIGFIKEQVFKSFFKVHTTYSILDAQKKEVAVSTKVDWIGTEVTLMAGSRRAAKLSRPWLNWFSDTWTVELDDQSAVDARLTVMIAAYKTAVDNERRAEESSKKRDKDDE